MQNMVYLKTMNWLKKFWIMFLSFLPIGAGAVAPFVIKGLIGATAVAGFSIYRNMSPVNMADALEFFSSCWTCQMFSDIMATMSNILPPIYDGLGGAIIPFAIILTAVWFAWQIVSDHMNAKTPEAWSFTTKFSTHLIKLTAVCALLAAPIPRMVTQIAIEPIFNVGLSLNRLVAHDDSFDSCVVSTALVDPTSDSADAANSGVFSPKLRHNLTCELAGVHQMTGLGMTVGWTMLNMSFDSEYMHKIMWAIPIFPNVILFVAGALIVGLFFLALLPIPLYFLEIFIKLSLDMVMLPLMLLGWLFDGWAISLKGAGKTIRSIIDDVINGTLGLAVTGVFVSFAIMFLNAIFGDWNGASVLSTALTQNDSKILIDALMMRNDSLVTIILMGLFMAAFMTMIPALAKSLFSITISTEFYDSAKKNLDTLWKGLKNVYAQIKK